MKERMLFLLLLLIPSGVFAQLHELADKFDMNKFDSAPSSEFRHFEYPVQILAYNGHKIEARAFMTYIFDGEKEDYEHLLIRIYLMPDSTDGFSRAVKDSIAKYATHNTLVYHALFYKSGYRQSVSGEADMYARAFSPLVSDESDKIRLKYYAVFDPRHSDSCRIDYRITDEPWERADKTEVLDFTGAGHGSSWIFRLHDIGEFDKDCFDPGTRKNCYLEVFTGFYSEINEPTRDLNEGVVCPDSLYATMSMKISGFNDKLGRVNSNLISNGVSVDGNTNMQRMSCRKNGSGEIIMQNTYPIFFQNEGKDRLPFFDNKEVVFLDCRASAKCRYIHVKDTGTKRLSGTWLAVEKATFSCMFYQNMP